MTLKARSILQRCAVAVLALLAVDTGISLLWPVLSKQPLQQQSMAEIRAALRAHRFAMPAGEQDLPPAKAAGEFVIGIFGGSVADQFALSLQQHTFEVPEFAELSRALRQPLRF